MKKKLRFSGLGILVVFLLLLGTYKLMNSRTYQVFGGLTDKVETDQKVSRLTFDDGPSKNVNQILPLLNKYDVKATFFLIGNEIEKYQRKLGKLRKPDTRLGITRIPTGEWFLNRPPISKRKSRKRIN